MKRFKGQQGFTLIEIAIVLVIVGLLLGAILKGQSMIDNARVSNAANSINGVIAGYFTYMDRYAALPGDDGDLARLQARGGAWVTAVGPTVAGDRDGLLENAAGVTFTGAGEGLGFWQHLRAAGIISGNPNTAGAAALPRNAFGGLTGITNTAVMGMPAGNKICLGSVPGAAAAALDTRLDDGVPNAGRLRANAGSATATNVAPVAAAGAAYNEGFAHTICMTF